MPIPIIGDIIKGVIGGAVGIFDDLHTSDEEKAEAKAKLAEVEANLIGALTAYETQLFAAQQATLVAEAKGNFLQKSWRPITMLCFVFIIVNNYVIVPYVTSFGGHVPTLEIPPGMWALLNVGIGGYIASRGVEKIVAMRNGGKP